MLKRIANVEAQIEAAEAFAAQLETCARIAQIENKISIAEAYIARLEARAFAIAPSVHCIPRRICPHCNRPNRVCVCEALPSKPLHLVRSRVLIV